MTDNTNSTAVDAVRASFEQHALTTGWHETDLRRKPDGTYLVQRAQDEWIVWHNAYSAGVLAMANAIAAKPKMSSGAEAVRKSFEAAHFKGRAIERQGDGYPIVGDQIAWLTWQAATTEAAARTQQLVAAAREVIRTELFFQDHPQKFAAQKALRAALAPFGDAPAPAFTQAQVLAAYTSLRKYNSSIPDEALDAMRAVLLAAAGSDQ